MFLAGKGLVGLIMKKATSLLLSFVLLFTGIVTVYSADVGNSTSTGNVNIPGRASSGNAAWADRQTSTMWKLTVYVAKDNSATFNESEIMTAGASNPLGSFSLSESFYKFGETFWLYEGTTSDGAVYSIYESKKSEYAKRFWFATMSKEDYIHDFKSKTRPGGSLNFNMTSSDCLEMRLFDVRKHNEIEGVSANGYPPKDGSIIKLPYVKNVNGNNGYYTQEEYDAAIQFFFCSSKNNWNCFLDFASKAAGYSDYSQLLLRMLEDRMFKYNGATITSFDDVDPKRRLSTSVAGMWDDETSQVAWVLVFEPVIVFYKYLENGYNYFAMSSSDAAAAMVSGCIAFTLTSGNNAYTLETGAKSGLNVAPGNLREQLSSWAFISPFFVNLCASVMPEYPWFGYRPLNSSDYYSISSDLLYYDRALLNGGIGFRYQAGGKRPPVTSSETKIIINKKISDGGSNPDFMGVRFLLSANVDSSLVSYTLDFSKLNGLSVNTPVNTHQSRLELLSSNGGYFVEALYEKVHDAEYGVIGRCTVRLTYNCSTANWTVRETGVQTGYDCIRFSTPNGDIRYSNSCTFKSVAGNTYSLFCENLKTSPLKIQKQVLDQNGSSVNDYEDLVFVISGVDCLNSSFGPVAVDSAGNIIGPHYELSGGSIVLRPTTLYDTDGDTMPINRTVSSVTVSVSNYNNRLTLTVNGLPDGDWKIGEYYKTAEAAEKCFLTKVKYGETDRPGYLYPQNRDNIAVTKQSFSNSYGDGNLTLVYFDNYVTSNAFDLSLAGNPPNAEYTAGTDVVTSYYVYNHSNGDVLTDRNINAFFEVFCYINGDRVSLFSAVKSNIVVPGNGSNIIWFKWRVPVDLGGSTVYCEATINSGNVVPESDYNNNGALVINDVKSPVSSGTPDTVYERTMPASFLYRGDEEVLNNELAEWYYYRQVGSSLVRTRYAVTFSNISVVTMTQDGDVPNDSTLSIRSGNGFYYENIQRVLAYTEASGILISDDAFTKVQSCKLLLPEYGFSGEPGCFKALQRIDSGLSPANESRFAFYENEYSDTVKRIHFVPVWYPDGKYPVVAVCGDLWTPAGMITSEVSSYIIVNGDTYDGWYTRR